MKKTLIYSTIASCLILLTSYKVFIKKINADALSVLGFSKSYADERVLWSLSNGLGPIIRPANMAQFISRSSADKTEITLQFCNYIKSYVYSQEFKDNYEAFRQSKKPVVQQFSEEEKAMQLEMIKQQEEMFSPEVLDMLPPEGKANALKSIEDMKKAATGELTDAQKEEWEAIAPSDPYRNIKSGLQKFLNESNDVDFSAPTKMNQNNKKIFTNPAYEKKPAYWKACYRAGKEVTDVGRSFAQEWLTELN